MKYFSVLRNYTSGNIFKCFINFLMQILPSIYYMQIFTDRPMCFRCNSADIYECEQLSAALLRLINWLIDGIAFAMANDNAALFVQFNTITLLFLLNPFVAVLLHFQSYYNPGMCEILLITITVLQIISTRR